VTGEEIALVVLIVAVTLSAAVALWVSSKRKGIVRANSAALDRLAALNSEFTPRLPKFSPIQYDFVEQVGSKAKFDRFDLTIMFYEQLSGVEAIVDHQLAERANAVAAHAAYMASYEQHRTALLGTSTSAELDPARFHKIERRLYERLRLREPHCVAQVTCTVTYTSPQGRNSYRRSAQWDFPQLGHGLAELRRVRTERSTTAFLRRQERNRMTSRLRAEVLRRDSSRCQMCGTTPHHGAIMHIDHIVPVSHGGTTVASNLQALCQDCNLGKSNVL